MRQLIVNANTPWAAQLPIWITPVRVPQAGGSQHADDDVADRRREEIHRRDLHRSKQGEGERLHRRRTTWSTRSETWMDTPGAGRRTLYEAVYSSYKDFGGVKVPTRITEQQGDYPTLEMTVVDAKINAPANIAPPQRGGRAPAGGGAPPAGTSSQKLGDGVFLILPGYAALAVDMKDGIVVIEGPQSDARGEAIIAEVKKDIPEQGDQIRRQHPRALRSFSGLRPFVAEGATIMTHQVNKGYFEKIFARPHTLNPDRLAQNKAKVNVETVGDKKVLTDGTHTIELISHAGNESQRRAALRVSAEGEDPRRGGFVQSAGAGRRATGGDAQSGQRQPARQHQPPQAGRRDHRADSLSAGWPKGDDRGAETRGWRTKHQPTSKVAAATVRWEQSVGAADDEDAVDRNRRRASGRGASRSKQRVDRRR